MITNCLVIINGTLEKRLLVIHSLQLKERFSTLQLPNDHYKPLSYDEEFRHIALDTTYYFHIIQPRSKIDK
jgi:hypothetical protein